MNFAIKFPEGMSDRDKQIILEMVRDYARSNPPKDDESEDAIAARVRAFVGEHLPYNTREID